ncbi:ParB/RepB/Spo0J family partition protein [Alkaliphilus crotonatoxidans]
MTKAKKRGLGKGLEALIPQVVEIEAESSQNEEDKIYSLDINHIYPNIEQPRRDFDRETILELANSIKAHGFIQPIIVSKEKDGYQIIAGERRWRAAKELQLKEIPCIIRQYEANRLLEIALIENLQREDLSVIEEALAYKKILEQHNLTQEQLAEALGKSRPYIANTLRLLHLDQRVIEMIKNNQITSGHGRVLLRVNNQEKQYQLALYIEKAGLNVRQVEELIASQKNTVKKKEKKQKSYELMELEDNLKKLFGTKVTISKGAKKGKIEIEYYNEDDLERIIEILDKR